jgi:hypothetical protein
MSIVAETEQIPNRRNSPLNSRAEISDGLARRFFVVAGKICAGKSARYHRLEQSSGSEGYSFPENSLYNPMTYQAMRMIDNTSAVPRLQSHNPLNKNDNW